MYQTDQAKLYCLYMTSDGQISEQERELFTGVCKELGLNYSEKKQIIEECEAIPAEDKFDKIKELIYGPAHAQKNDSWNKSYFWKKSYYSFFHDSVNHEDMLWNLINLGYADTKYTDQERKIVEFLKSYWNVRDDVYEEMIDVAETCLALEEYKNWIEDHEELDNKEEKINQINKDINVSLKDIQTTLSELRS